MKQIQTEQNVIYINESLYVDLKNGILEAKKLLERTKKVVENNCISVIWGDALVWALLTNAEVAQHIQSLILKTRAEVSGLDCGLELASADRSSTQKDNFRLLSAMAHQETEVIHTFIILQKYRTNELRNLTTYMRAKALYIGAKGEIFISDDYDRLLRDYCSVIVRPGNEQKRYGEIKEIFDSVRKVQNLHDKFAEGITDKEKQDDIKAESDKYTRLSFASGMPFHSPASLWRAFVRYGSERKADDTAKFYNDIGQVRLDGRQLYNVCGYLETPTPERRLQYPDLYKDIPFQGPWDSLEGLERLKDTRNEH